jgi:hypothetical protein
MKKFLKYTFGVLMTVMILMVILDAIYTKVYETAQPRNKFQYILSLKPQRIDYVFLGSSRVANTIVTEEIRRVTGKKVINLGIEGAWLDDNYLQLKLLINQGITIEKVFLQIDYQFEDSERTAIAKADAIPFIHNPIIKEHLKNKENDFLKMVYIPFYRYLKTDHKVGFREVFLLLIKKKPKVNLENGYTPQIGSSILKSYSLPKQVADKNEMLNAIQRLCMKHKIDLVLFCAPFCSKTVNRDYIDKLKKKLPQLQDYSAKFDDSLFFDCAHLNDKGALLFTKKIIQKNFNYAKQ